MPRARARRPVGRALAVMALSSLALAAVAPARDVHAAPAPPRATAPSPAAAAARAPAPAPAAPPPARMGTAAPSDASRPAASPAAAAATAALVARLDAASARVETLAADFTQRNRVKLFKQELRQAGRLRYQRPRRIRWEYVTPDPSTLVLDGERATLRSPGAPPEVFDLARDPAMRAVFDQILLWLGAGSVRAAERDYLLVAGGAADAPTLTLTPRPASPAARVVARVELRFDRALTLRSILLVEAAGDEKEIGFTHVEKNVRLPPDTFR